MADTEMSQYKVWAAEDVVYGPVDLLTLLDWIQEQRVDPATWIYVVGQDHWHHAGELSELQPHLVQAKPSQATALQPTPLVPGIRPGTLRRVKVFATMTDQQLGRFVQFMEVVQLPQFRDVCRTGETGDAMFCVLEGELRARILVDNKETTLATLKPGDVFGEVALFDQRPRSADVVTHSDTTLLRISAERFRALCEQFPDLATPFLLALGQTLTLRLRDINKRLSTTISMSRAGFDVLNSL